MFWLAFAAHALPELGWWLAGGRGSGNNNAAKKGSIDLRRASGNHNVAGAAALLSRGLHKRLMLLAACHPPALA